MAGGIDWFRWHHGSVTDPKFQLVARKSGASLPVVLAVWAYVLESASQSADRGSFDIDAEALDCMFSLDDGTTAKVLAVMADRDLIDGGRVAAWEKRQPKREREGDSSTDRTRAYRERLKQQGDADSADVTPSDATERQETPREEKSREEEKETPPTPRAGGVVVPDWMPQAEWDAFVAMRRAKGKRAPFTVQAAKGVIAKLDRFRAAGQDVAAVLEESVINGWSDVYEPKAKGKPASAPASGCPDWCRAAGFANVYEANNEGCREHNAHQFHDGKRVEVPA